MTTAGAMSASLPPPDETSPTDAHTDDAPDIPAAVATAHPPPAKRRRQPPTIDFTGYYHKQLDPQLSAADSSSYIRSDASAPPPEHIDDGIVTSGQRETLAAAAAATMQLDPALSGEVPSSPPHPPPLPASGRDGGQETFDAPLNAMGDGKDGAERGMTTKKGLPKLKTREADEDERDRRVRRREQLIREVEEMRRILRAKEKEIDELT